MAIPGPVPFIREVGVVLTVAAAGATPPVDGGATMTATNPKSDSRRGCLVGTGVYHSNGRLDNIVLRRIRERA